MSQQPSGLKIEIVQKLSNARFVYCFVVKRRIDLATPLRCIKSTTTSYGNCDAITRTHGMPGIAAVPTDAKCLSCPWKDSVYYHMPRPSPSIQGCLVNQSGDIWETALQATSKQRLRRDASFAHLNPCMKIVPNARTLASIPYRWRVLNSLEMLRTRAPELHVGTQH